MNVFEQYTDFYCTTNNRKDVTKVKCKSVIKNVAKFTHMDIGCPHDKSLNDETLNEPHN